MKNKLPIYNTAYGLRCYENKTPFDLRENQYKCKVYHDGGHYVATFKIDQAKKSFNYRKPKGFIDKCFDALYFNGVKDGLRSREMFLYIKDKLVNVYCVAEDNDKLNEYLILKIKSKLNNFHHRVKRFKRKAYLNRWNYFCTFTYDDRKHNADSFRRKLKRCLSNLHTRRKWRYMGVFEYAPETNRVHFHCLMFIPEKEMVGTIKEVKDYSTAKHQMQLSHSNTFFAKKFGRNDFAPIKDTEMTLGYILKYLRKSGERIVYSRGIATEIVKMINKDDIVAQMYDFVYKFILFDDVLSWEYDVMNYRPIQETMFECSA